MHRRFVWLLLILIFIAVCLPLVFRGHFPGYYYEVFDEEVYHLPAIEKFANEFPHVDLVGYKLAMSPLYHIFLAVLYKYFFLNLYEIRIINMVFGLLCLLLFFTYLRSHRDQNKALLVTCCLLFSPYFLGPSIRVSTDNVAFLFALAALFLLDPNVALGIKCRFLLSSLFNTIALLIRQIYVWIAAVGFITVCCVRKKETQKRRFFPAFYYLLPIAAALVLFLLWRWFTPPLLELRHQGTKGINFDAIIFGISVLGELGVFFSLWFLDFYKRNSGSLLQLICLVLLCWIFMIIHPMPDAIARDVGDGALWKIAAAAPVLHKTSLVFWILFPLGAVFLYTTLINFKAHGHIFPFLVYVIWLASNCLNHLTWHKYFEPFTFFYIGYAIQYSRASSWRFYSGPLLFLALYIAIALKRYILYFG
jgi:hypothetical protein